ncbi:LysR family transcriptional regulator [Sporomusaceae bacterium FL31]|nr:LysR family transcriptional regulator [Sporomusaceae bacterium FL31]GCE34986.1 LysR family transcriptional regulator [Sporomusaceae bacterium]
MDIKQIKAFVTVATLNNFTRAAEQLGYVQSSITSQIQLLEKELGVSLFERLGKKISLTAEGEEFLIHSRQMINLWEKAKGSVAASDVPKGKLVIGAHESICAFFLPEILQEYNRRYPDVELVIKMGSWCDFESDLRENQIDVAILIDRKLSVSEFVIDKERNEPFALLASPEHPLSGREHVYAKDVAEYPLLMTGEGCSWRVLFKRALENSETALQLMSEGGSIQTLKRLASFGLGVTLLPLFAAEDEIKFEHLKKLNFCGIDLNLLIQVVYHKDKWVSSALAAFLEICKEKW